MKSTFLILVSVILVCGCSDETAAERQARRDARKRRGDDTEIKKPVRSEGIGKAQALQIKARATGMRELAEKFRDGSIVTIWDADKAYVETDRAARKQLDSEFGKRMEREFGNNDKDKLPRDADKIFEEIASELEGILK